jgi:hypothetical protein
MLIVQICWRRVVPSAIFGITKYFRLNASDIGTLGKKGRSCGVLVRLLPERLDFQNSLKKSRKAVAKETDLG